MQRDLWVGVAWAGGLVIAMVAVFTYGLMAYEPAEFDVVWKDNEHEHDVGGGTLAETETARHTVAVPGLNVTRLVFLLEWADDVEPANDEFELEVEGLDWQDTARASGGRMEVPFDVADPPTVSTASGANAEHALAQLDRPTTPWSGDAEWRVTVRLVSAPGSAGTGGLGLDPEADGSNPYTVRLVRVTTDAALVPRS